MNKVLTSTAIVGLGVWILLAGGSPAAPAPESGPSPSAQPDLTALVETAKTQALFQVQQDMNMRSILWYRPYGLVIVLSQDPSSPFQIRLLEMEGLGENKIAFSYSKKEAELLKNGGVIRVFSADHIDADLRLTFSGNFKDSSGQSRNSSASLSIDHRKLPAVVELRISTSKGEETLWSPVVLGKSDSSRLTDLFTRHVRYLIDTESHLEAAALLTILRGEQEKGLKDQEGWSMDLASTLVKWNVRGQAFPILQEMTKAGLSAKQKSLAWFYIGKIHYKDGNYENALEAFSKAKTDLPPEYLPEILYLTGNSHLYLKSFRPAVQSLDQVPAGSEFRPYALYSRGLAYLNQGDLEATRKSFKKLMEINPFSDELLALLIDRARITLGYFLVDQKLYEEAIETFSGIREKSLYEDQSRFGIGWALFNMGQCDRAAVVFDDLVSNWPASVYSEEARLKAGLCYSQLGARRKAVESFQEALRQFSLKQDALQSLEQDLTRSNLRDWLNVQRQQFSDPEKRNPLIRDLTSEGSVQRAIAEFESLKVLSDEVDRIEKSLDESLRTAAFKKRLTQMQGQVEDAAKAELAREIARIQKQVEQRANQADIGLLRNFALEAQ